MKFKLTVEMAVNAVTNLIESESQLFYVYVKIRMHSQPMISSLWVLFSMPVTKSIGTSCFKVFNDPDVLKRAIH